MNITMVNVAYGLPQANFRLMTSFYGPSKHQLSAKLFLHSNSPEVMTMAKEAQGKWGVQVLYYCFNRGLSRSWNEGILAAFEEGADLVYVVNDDIEFSPGDVDKLADHCSTLDNDCAVVGTWGRDLRSNQEGGHGYSCFAILPQAIERVGCFDQNIFPIYFEDVDYSYRVARAGMHESFCPGTMVLHAGSAAIRTDPRLSEQNNLTFACNKEYYLRKWGGEPHQERFVYPFNNPAFSFYISPDKRHEPYGPGYDRTDQSIVQL